ncbi:hypothetical protein JTE90_012611, partial [Oedothorax gibbosus]
MLVKFATQGIDQFLLVGASKTSKLALVSQWWNRPNLPSFSVRVKSGTCAPKHQLTICQCPSVLFKGEVSLVVGNMLRIYDIGKKKLLRKCENK